MSISARRLFHAFKYSVYALLTLNILLFLQENLVLAEAGFPTGVPLANFIETFAETIDTVAWVILLLMFELETTVFLRHQPGIAPTRIMQGIRLLCFALIIYSLYGYLTRAIDLSPTSAAAFYLAWLDVINAAAWLLVVLVLEFDVRLQERGQRGSIALRISTGLKSILYPLLLLAAIYWGIKGDLVDAWDALLWIVAFVFIELNVFGWRRPFDCETAG